MIRLTEMRRDLRTKTVVGRSRTFPALQDRAPTQATPRSGRRGAARIAFACRRSSLERKLLEALGAVLMHSPVRDNIFRKAV